MKKINFTVILLTFIASIVTFFYVDVLAELIVKTVSNGEFEKVTNYDIFMAILVTIVCSIFPSWALAYAYRKIQISNWWVVFISIIYTIVWIGISFFLMSGYITYFGNTWLSSEILDYTIKQNHFYLAYFLSLIPMLVVGIFNRSEY